MNVTTRKCLKEDRFNYITFQLQQL